MSKLRSAQKARKRSPPRQRLKRFLVTLKELAYGLHVDGKNRRQVRRRMASSGFTVTHLKEIPSISRRLRHRRNHVRQA